MEIFRVGITVNKEPRIDHYFMSEETANRFIGAFRTMLNARGQENVKFECVIEEVFETNEEVVAYIMDSLDGAKQMQDDRD